MRRRRNKFNKSHGKYYTTFLQSAAQLNICKSVLKNCKYASRRGSGAGVARLCAPGREAARSVSFASDLVAPFTLRQTTVFSLPCLGIYHWLRAKPLIRRRVLRCLTRVTSLPFAASHQAATQHPTLQKVGEEQPRDRGRTRAPLRLRRVWRRLDSPRLSMGGSKRNAADSPRV